MIFLGRLATITETKSKVGYIHYMPFDEKDGLGKTQEELEAEGILVESIPEPVTPEGQVETLYVNPLTKELFYEYTDIVAVPFTQEQEIVSLKQEMADMQIAINMALGL